MEDTPAAFHPREGPIFGQITTCNVFFIQKIALILASCTNDVLCVDKLYFVIKDYKILILYMHY